MSEMFVTSLGIVLGCQSFLCVANVVATTLKTTKVVTGSDSKLLNILKQDLRRNNDDYLDKTLNNTKTITIPTLISETEKATFAITNKLYDKNYDINENKYNITNVKRRAYEEEIINDNGKVLNNPKGQDDQHRFITVTSQQYDANLQMKYKNVASGYPKYINKEKVYKLMKFLEKNKGLVKEFMISKKEMQTQTESIKIVDSSYNIHIDTDVGEADAVPRVRMDEEFYYNRAPIPAQLDMAPAKGGRVLDLRNKNRLCYRHVMIPEGPKYDSKGNVYLRAYSPVRGNDYANTMPPKHILPKCCNCCKKSVLGCE